MIVYGWTFYKNGSRGRVTHYRPCVAMTWSVCLTCVKVSAATLDCFARVTSVYPMMQTCRIPIPTVEWFVTVTQEPQYP